MPSRPAQEGQRRFDRFDIRPSVFPEPAREFGADDPDLRPLLGDQCAVQTLSSPTNSQLQQSSVAHLYAVSPARWCVAQERVSSSRANTDAVNHEKPDFFSASTSDRNSGGILPGFSVLHHGCVEHGLERPASGPFHDESLPSVEASTGRAGPRARGLNSRGMTASRLACRPVGRMSNRLRPVVPTGHVVRRVHMPACRRRAAERGWKISPRSALWHPSEMGGFFGVRAGGRWWCHAGDVFTQSISKKPPDRLMLLSFPLIRRPLP